MLNWELHNDLKNGNFTSIEIHVNIGTWLDIHGPLSSFLISGFDWALLLQELLDKVVQFQKDAQEALDAETPDSEKLEQLIEFSVTLDVDLPEIPKLKQVSVKQDSGDRFSILIF